MDEQFITPTTDQSGAPQSPFQSAMTPTPQPIPEIPARPSQNPKPKRSKKPLILILLAIILIASAGAGVYYWQHKKVTDQNKRITSLQSQITNLQKSTSSTSTTTTSTTQSTPTSTTNVLVISEWGVKLTFADADKVTYSLEQQQDGSSVANFSLKSSVTTIANCQDMQTALMRTSTGPASSSVHKVGNYYYHIVGDPSSCSDPNGENGSITQERNKVNSELGNNYTIEAN